MRHKILLNCLFTATLAASASHCLAKTVTLRASQIINTPTSYNHVTLNVNGGFIIQPGGSLDIENSIVNVTIAPGSDFFTWMTTGALTLKNNTFIVTVSGISPNPTTLQPYELVKVDQGSLTMIHNSFVVNQPYSVAIVTTNASLLTNGFNISQNTFKNFHGGLYLSNSNGAQISENAFDNVSLSNIWETGLSTTIKANIFTFPGNLSTGNAMDIVNAKDVDISDNIISSGTNYGVHLLGATNVMISNNKISDNQSYAILIENPSTFKNAKSLAQSASKQKSATFAGFSNTDITITGNYLAQNRYGLRADNANLLTVIDNYFIQRFPDPASRSYWTNNTNLLTDVTNLTWVHNYYKEAFTQEVPGVNDLTKQFVRFPEDGGVTL